MLLSSQSSSLVIVNLQTSLDYLPCNPITEEPGQLKQLSTVPLNVSSRRALPQPLHKGVLLHGPGRAPRLNV